MVQYTLDTLVGGLSLVTLDCVSSPLLDKRGVALNHNNKLIGAYPSGWIWPTDDFDFMKCLIPFFDGLAIFMPEELAEQVIDSDPYLARPLFELGYLRNIDPDISLDKDLSNRILEMVKRFVEDEHFPAVGARLRRTTRSAAHFGFLANPQEVLDFLKDMEHMGLASAISKDGTFAAQSDVCKAIVENCFSALSQKLQSSGIELVPVKQGTDSGYGLWRSAREYYTPGIIELDLQEVGVDLRAVPLDEILDFSSRYRMQYQSYLRGIREMMRALRNAHDKSEIESIKRDRLEAIEDQRAFLKRASRSEFRRQSLSLLVGIAGSAWTLRTGDAVAAALAAAATAVGLAPSSQQPSAYSYLFIVADRGHR
jgi:hypothetical protein